MGKPVVILMCFALTCAAAAPALAGTPDSDRVPLSVSSMLDGYEPGFSASGLVPTATDLLNLKPGEKARYYARVAPGIEILDGGPNISGYPTASPSYKDAYTVGMSVSLEVWARFSPNIYLVIAAGGAQFGGDREFKYPTGNTLSLSSLMFGTFTVGGAFAAPLSFVLPGSKSLTDEEGLLATFKFDLGVCTQGAVSATIEDSPTPSSIGQKYDYWQTRVGFTGSLSFGLEYRIGTFSVFIDTGFKTYGKPVSATTPSWAGDAQTMLVYPIRAGVSYRF